MERVWVLTGVAVVVAMGCVGSETPPHGDAGVIAIIDANVVPMDRERLLKRHTVVVREGRISALGPSDELVIPEGAMRIDGSSSYLMPGLAEMHGHLPSRDMPSEVTENVLFLYVANGVTTVRGMQGNPIQLELRSRIERGELWGPRLIVGSPSMEGDSIKTVEDAERRVREYKDAGFDLLKVHERLSAEVYDTIAATARDVGIPFGGHVTDEVGLFRALQAGQTTIDHLDNYVEALIPEERMPAEPPGLRGIDGFLDRVDETRMDRVVRATLDADASVVATLVLWESGIFPLRPSAELLAERTEVRYMPEDVVARWVEVVDEARAQKDPEAMRRLAELRRRILIALHRGGVRILLGTDSPQIFSVPGFSIHREMALYVDAGMSPYDVLSSGTRVVGEYFREKLGTVEVGARADLILIEGNPLEDLGNVRRRKGVMAHGRWIAEEDIQARLQQIAASYGR